MYSVPTAQTKHQVERALLLNVVVTQDQGATVLQLLACEDDTVRRIALQYVCMFKCYKNDLFLW